MSNMSSNLSNLYSVQPVGDVSSCEVTLLNQLNERRDSTSSTMSSAYISRRSSGISPCYSSRRSSETSQFGANRHNNISSADSYDPISTDLSRRSSEASHCGGGRGGLPSLLSLTPAQHYRLKAKYAAAIGGAPPTPLPNMDRMNLRTRMAVYGDPQNGSVHPLHQLPVGSAPRRCSDIRYISYSGQSMMPYEVPASLPRRASDPVRCPPLDPLSFPRIQRHSSTNSINPPTGSLGANHHQSHARSDGCLQRYPFAPRPPSISEDIAMETMAEDVGPGGEDDMVLPDDVVQYLRSQNNNSCQLDYSSHQPQLGSGPVPAFYTHKRTDTSANQCSPDLRSCQMGQQHYLTRPENPNKNNMPVQWNEVSSGTMDGPTRLPKQNQHPLRSNLAVVQQRHNFGLLQVPNPGLNGTQQAVPLAIMNVPVQGPGNPNNQRSMNSAVHQNHQQGFCHELCLSSGPGGSGMRPSHSGTTDPEPQSYGARTQTDGYPGHMIQVDQNYNIPSQENVMRGNLQPRVPTEPRSGTRQLSGSGMAQPSRTPRLSDLSPRHPNDSSEASPKRPSKSENQNPAVFYTGQIHMINPLSISLDASASPNISVAANMASPGVNQVSSSTADSSSTRSGSGSRPTEHTQIDFDSMLDDGDHSSLMSGTLSPGLLQNLSQSSSRLTTPRNSVTLGSVPAGIGNMAIGDMSSMLTALAEESKFLNMIS